MDNKNNIKDRVAAFVNSRREDTISYLGQLIDCKGGSEDRARVNRVGDLLAARVTALGFQLQRHTPHTYGDHLVLKNGGGGRPGGAGRSHGHHLHRLRRFARLPPGRRPRRGPGHR